MRWGEGMRERQCEVGRGCEGGRYEGERECEGCIQERCEAQGV